MLEIVVPIALAAVTGLAAVTNRLHNRIHELDKRVDEVELRVAEKYVSKADLDGMIDRVESHLIRLEISSTNSHTGEQYSYNYLQLR